MEISRTGELQHITDIRPEVDMVAAVPWTKEEATPMSDLDALRHSGMCSFGDRYERATMSPWTANLIACSKEFQERVKRITYPLNDKAPPEWLAYYCQKHFGNLFTDMTRMEPHVADMADGVVILSPKSEGVRITPTDVRGEFLRYEYSRVARLRCITPPASRLART